MDGGAGRQVVRSPGRKARPFSLELHEFGYRWPYCLLPTAYCRFCLALAGMALLFACCRALSVRMPLAHQVQSVKLFDTESLRALKRGTPECIMLEGCG